MSMKGTLIASLSALTLGVATIATPASAAQFHGGGGGHSFGGGGHSFGGGGHSFGGGGHSFGGGGHSFGGGGHFNAAPRGIGQPGTFSYNQSLSQGSGARGGAFGWNHGGHHGGWRGGGWHGGGWGWGPAIGLGIVGGALAAGAYGAYDYDYDDCYRYRPIYDSWGNYLGRRLVNICE